MSTSPMSTVSLGNPERGGLSKVSAIGFGVMNIVGVYGSELSDEASVALLKAVHDVGCTHFDTAEMYRSGNPFTDPVTDKTRFSEGILGKFLRTVPRDSFTVATKFFPLFHGGKVDLATVEASLDASLARLGLPYVDLYYCHRMPATVELLEEWMRSAKALVAAGKVRAIGLSEVSASWLRRAVAVAPVAAIQMEWSLVTRSIEKDLIPTAKELDVAIVAYSPLARDLLAKPTERPQDWRASLPRYAEENFKRNVELAQQIEKRAAELGATAAQLSLAWLYQKARDLGVTLVAIPGSTKVPHALDNIRSLSFLPLAPAVSRDLEELGALVAGERYPEDIMAMSYEKQQ